MLKKTLCVFVVLTLIAQICARPEGKDDTETTANEYAEKAVKEGQDNADEVGVKGQGEVKAHADEAKETSENLQNKGNEAAEALRKNAHGLHGDNGAQSNGQQHGLKMSAIIREAERTGEKVIKTGTNMFAGFLNKIGL